MKWADRTKLLFLAIAVTLATGCLSSELQAIRNMHPQPNIDLPRRRIALALEVSPMIADQFTVPWDRGISEVPVSNYRDAIAHGYWSAVSLYFALRGTPRFTLSISQCDLDFVPSLVRVTRTYQSVATARARIRYLATLKSETGEVVGRARAEIISDVEWVEIGGAGRAAENALALMWVDIADRLLVNIPVPVAPAQRSLESSGAEQLPTAPRAPRTW